MGGNLKSLDPLPSRHYHQSVSHENAIFIAQTEITSLNDLSLDGDIPDNVSNGD
jgi:hypothetical protein